MRDGEGHVREARGGHGAGAAAPACGSPKAGGEEASGDRRDEAEEYRGRGYGKEDEYGAGCGDGEEDELEFGESESGDEIKAFELDSGMFCSYDDEAVLFMWCLCYYWPWAFGLVSMCANYSTYGSNLLRNPLRNSCLRRRRTLRLPALAPRQRRLRETSRAQFPRHGLGWEQQLEGRWPRRPPRLHALRDRLSLEGWRLETGLVLQRVGPPAAGRQSSRNLRFVHAGNGLGRLVGS